MMDAYNLAICFGPTLLPIPKNSNDLVVKSNQANELVMNMIELQDRVFVTDDDGSTVYEKCIVDDR